MKRQRLSPKWQIGQRQPETAKRDNGVSGCLNYLRSLEQNMAYRRHTHSLPLLGGKRFQAAFGRCKGSLKMQNRLVFCQKVFCRMDWISGCLVYQLRLILLPHSQQAA